uniref:serine/threonine-protein kinase 19-like n=1 Tax=Lonchura striata TaxID=40157 RepID=UPI001292F643|nr:serine/threonine-protein kinase 19-like [Lonchura striata domestica]
MGSRCSHPGGFPVFPVNSPALPVGSPGSDGAVPAGSPAAVEAALGAVAALFPRRLFGDALPPLLLRHQLYSVLPDRTAVDRHLLVAAGLLTVRDAGSWWLAVPGAGRFVRALLRGRRAVLSLVRRSRLRQLPLQDLRGGKTPPGAALGVPFLLHDLLGEGRLQSVPTAAGPLLRLAEP